MRLAQHGATPHLEHTEVVAVVKETIGGTKTLALATWLLDGQQASLLLHTGTISCLLGGTRGKESTGTCRADPTLSEKEICDDVLGNDLPDWYSPLSRGKSGCTEGRALVSPSCESPTSHRTKSSFSGRVFAADLCLGSSQLRAEGGTSRSAGLSITSAPRNTLD